MKDYYDGRVCRQKRGRIGRTGKLVILDGLEEQVSGEEFCDHKKKPFLKNSISRHIRREHIPVKVDCNDCGLKLETINKLFVHQQKVHTISTEKCVPSQVKIHTSHKIILFGTNLISMKGNI